MFFQDCAQLLLLFRPLMHSQGLYWSLPPPQSLISLIFHSRNQSPLYMKYRSAPGHLSHENKTIGASHSLTAPTLCPLTNLLRTSTLCRVRRCHFTHKLSKDRCHGFIPASRFSLYRLFKIPVSWPGKRSFMKVPYYSRFTVPGFPTDNLYLYPVTGLPRNEKILYFFACSY